MPHPLRSLPHRGVSRDPQPPHRGVAALVATAIISLDLVMPLWLAALVVGVVLLAVAGLLALVGKKQVSEAAPPAERTVHNVKADIDTVRGGNHP